MRIVALALAVILAGACMPSHLKVFPAPPPGSSAATDPAADEYPKGADGAIYHLGSHKRQVAAAYREIRAYCGGPFTVLEERERRVMTPLSFPIPELRHYIYFRCGVGADEPQG